MPTFAFVTEGLLDQIVLADILTGYFDDPNLEFRPLQPPQGVPGGWPQVLRYCESIEFKQQFATDNIVVIQIDTDVCEDFGIQKQIPGDGPSTDALIDRVSNLLISKIGQRFYDTYQDRIIFAISVDSIECWLLPVYYADNKRSAETGCLNKLNQYLLKQEGYTIDPKRKEEKYYVRITEALRRPKTIDKLRHGNRSIQRFLLRLDELRTKKAPL